MSPPVNCRYFYGDYFRGQEKENCRLLEASPANRRSWQRKLCDSCSVPALLLETNCRDLMLEAEVTRSFIRERVQVTFSVCARHLTELDDPLHCPQCAAELG